MNSETKLARISSKNLSTLFSIRSPSGRTFIIRFVVYLRFTRKLITLACIDHEQIVLHRGFEREFFFHLQSSILGVENYLDFTRYESIRQYEEVAQPKAYLNNWLKMEDLEENYARSQLLVFLGVTEGEVEEKNDRFGPLDG